MGHFEDNTHMKCQRCAKYYKRKEMHIFLPTGGLLCYSCYKNEMGIRALMNR